MERLILNGTYTALVTPFLPDFSIDFTSLHNIIEQQINSNIEGLVILGSTAEAHTLSMPEKTDLMLKIQEQVDGRIPIIVGTGSNDTKATIEFTKLAEEHHFDGVLLVAPYYNKPSQKGIFQHFLSISEASNIPQIIYNIPSRTGVNILPETTQKIAEKCKNIIGIKEASGDLQQIMSVIHNTPSNFAVLSGDDALAVPVVLMGGHGVISVLANYAPILFGNCIRLALQKNINMAVDMHYKLFDMMKINFVESNPIPVKAIMRELQLIQHSTVRLPLTQSTNSNFGKFISTLTNWNN